MHATIDAQFTLVSTQTKRYRLPLAESLTEIQLEATILEEIVRSLDRRSSRRIAEKHARGNGDRRFQRANRHEQPFAGEHEFTLHHVKDTAATGTIQPTSGHSRISSNSTDNVSIKRMFRSRVPTSLRRSAFVMPSPTATAIMPSKRRSTVESREYGSKLR